MAQGHMIPMIDIARLLAERGAVATIVTTPVNAARFEPVITRAVESGLRISFLCFQFPCAEAGLPEGHENFDIIDSLDLDKFMNVLTVVNKLGDPVQKLLEELTPRPSCIISDMCFPYASSIASRLQIPIIGFHGLGCFCISALYNLNTSKILDSVKSDSEYFVIPNLPNKVEFTKAQVPDAAPKEKFKDLSEKCGAADLALYGVIINTFEELEPEYIKDYRKVKERVWCFGPLSLCNKNEDDKAQRGNKSTVDDHQCLTWLDSQAPRSVIYACFGSINNVPPPQMIELGLALEASNRPFIWVIRNWKRLNELEKWISEDGFEERIKGRGLLIKGWAPQLLILSHPAIAGFLTHCGWNSTIEGISAGVPLITWPLFGDQFFNEKLAAQILKIGVGVGVKKSLVWGEEDKIGVLVKREDIKSAIDKVMGEGKEGEERRRRAKELAEMAKKAVEEGGSSHLNVTRFIQDIMEQQSHH